MTISETLRELILTLEEDPNQFALRFSSSSYSLDRLGPGEVVSRSADVFDEATDSNFLQPDGTAIRVRRQEDGRWLISWAGRVFTHDRVSEPRLCNGELMYGAEDGDVCHIQWGAHSFEPFQRIGSIEFIGEHKLLLFTAERENSWGVWQARRDSTLGIVVDLVSPQKFTYVSKPQYAFGRPIYAAAWEANAKYVACIGTEMSMFYDEVFEPEVDLENQLVVFYARRHRSIYRITRTLDA